MKKFFLSLAVFVMALCANAQTNQYFWYNGNLMMGNPIAQIDSVTFGEGEPADTLHIMLPRTIIKTVHDTVYITIHDTVCPNDIPEGALAGEFSVSATKKIRFSKGNLQYQASTGTWRFADNQYDVIGYANSNISTTYNGWIDLFGWGTGDNPIKTSTSPSAYSSFVDWGNNAISNGGNEINQWRSLTKDEWVYIAHERTNAANLFGFANINGINGLILLPDNWTSTGDIPSFSTGADNGVTWQSNMYYNSSSNNFSQNTFTIDQWLLLESKGAIFLPAAGYRKGTYVGNLNAHGSYWTPTIYDEDEAYDCEIEDDSFYPQDYEQSRDLGQQVRLVQDIE